MRADEQVPPLRSAAKGEQDVSPEEMFRAYGRAVMAVCLANVRNPHDAEDIMQEVFLKAMKGWGELRDRGVAKSWLLQIARRMCIDYYRRKKPVASLTEEVPATDAFDDSEARRVHQAVSRLPDEYRETISLYYLDGRSCASVAEALGISPEAVRTRLVRGRLMLHDLLSEGQS